MSDKLANMIVLDKFLEGNTKFRGVLEQIQQFCHGQEKDNVKTIL